MKRKIILLLSVVLLILSGCEKGDTGPAGTAGPQGPIGNANVKHQLFSCTASSWTHIGTAGQQGDGYAHTEACSLLTFSVVNTGGVLVFFSIDNVTWDAMPLTVHLDAGSSLYSESFFFEFKENEITFYIMDSDFQTQLPLNLLYFRVVTIDGSMISNPNINWSDYDQVRKIIN